MPDNSQGDVSVEPERHSRALLTAASTTGPIRQSCIVNCQANRPVTNDQRGYGEHMCRLCFAGDGGFIKFCYFSWQEPKLELRSGHDSQRRMFDHVCHVGLRGKLHDLPSGASEVRSGDLKRLWP